MEKKLEKKVSVSYTYDPKVKTLEVICDYNGTRDSFCAMFDDHPTHKTVHEFISGFILFLQEKQQQQQWEKERGNENNGQFFGFCRWIYKIG